MVGYYQMHAYHFNIIPACTKKRKGVVHIVVFVFPAREKPAEVGGVDRT